MLKYASNSSNPKSVNPRSSSFSWQPLEFDGSSYLLTFFEPTWTTFQELQVSRSFAKVEGELELFIPSFPACSKILPKKTNLLKVTADKARCHMGALQCFATQ